MGIMAPKHNCIQSQDGVIRFALAYMDHKVWSEVVIWLALLQPVKVGNAMADRFYHDLNGHE